MKAALFAFFLFLLLPGPASADQGQVTLGNGKTVAWPPQIGKPYPELELKDGAGKLVKLADFRGKVIIVEPVGMTCPACNAFSGGKEKGGFKNNPVQPDLDAIEKFFPQYTGVSLHDPRIVFVQVLLYNLQMQGTTQDDAALWAEHFGLDKSPNTYVLAGGPELVGPASYALIPGFQLIDRDFVLRSDATGDNPKESIWTDLLPKVPQLLKEVRIEEPGKISQSMTVEEAYKAIPHNKTRFDPATATMSADEKAFLDAFFTLSDLAVAERVETQAALRSKGQAAGNYDEILRRLKGLGVPPKLKTAYGLVVEAVEEQRAYLDSLKNGTAFDAAAPLVEDSHQKLTQAYGELMRIYPSENSHNRQAFFDHLCALDFK